MKKLLLAASLLLFQNYRAQNQGRTCGTAVLPQQFESWLQSLPQPAPGKNSSSEVQSVFNIPVIVHVIHNNESVNSVNATSGNNLNAAQIIDQINILNKDYNGTNADTNLIPAVFKPALGKFNVNFCLAVVNPTGGILAEPGIDRINRQSKGWSAPPYSQTYIDANVKPNSIWNPNYYLNIWVCPLSNGLLGYATFPNPGSSGVQGIPSPYGTATTDGVVILNTAFGSIGTASSGSYNKGRTATHEVGHWVGLRHIWGDGTCATDYCNDTPPAQTSNYNCPAFPYHVGTCSGNTTGEMTMNYMDYTNDACMYMFTKDQKVRAQLILSNSAMRASLVTSTVCNLPSVSNDPGISSIVSPTYSQVIACPAVLSPDVNITNYGAVTLTSAVIAYNVDGANTQTLNWSGSINPNSTSLVALPQITVGVQGQHNYSVNISSPNGGSDANMINNNSTQSFSVSGILISVSGGSTCPGVPLTISASGAGTYSWNTGATAATIAPAPSVTTVYTVTGTSGQCSSSKTVAVTVNALPTVNVNKQSVCYGTTSTVTATGAPSYSWNTGSTASTETVNITTATVFTVTGFLSPVCYTSKVFTLTVDPLPTTTLMATNLSCSTCIDGTITIVPGGGTAPYSYTWMPGGSNASELDDIEGCYTLTISDALGCLNTDSICSTFDLGIGDLNYAPNLVKVSPNPSRGLFKIENHNTISLRIEVRDALGRMIRQESTTASVSEINLSAEAKGVYYLKVVSDNRYMVLKLVKE